ncbi:50S ribosomal protein L32 [candidate division WOR-1 bacterium RIFOXYA12_FULL_52_29]|uniref:Large ribosomal subunit protein bL32 n=1 Tax=candidate division WOR-1 bacterium RIFOXYC12_FULL_54_18 TaxID=1802584 RepID=A0A1F4T8V1_UNCSA|nr:MAG: 50S ribosomal protein L32 [candidate division WOR-1 bacterium RIFOXYA2_FULL_51_19]OGC18046.1 MAG: 50S ribosomal protein L32 [candidate division WOR-1 bacterium RIFOXYA12_FULL_52_29]OGC26902.1 MAG: 50S ribosomal protein L32 [candidate division WOR-1 bacterium RIFOXYB2_FULL_45_9]OGC28463.1 MAG: 50S ribosomal protein L32 [candidate division WOR-1 bacterium RIFOXYC12_FULL_54_18]OGC31082.1 MAG: 50S ribosomal protein L32 [candidate division WOR-1 bacterium RIFOXYB12_FULL_52_16]
MPVPKKRHSNSRQGKRRASNYVLTAPNVGKCRQCGSPSLPHQVCPTCGTYKGKQVLKLKEKKKGKK